jgi:hypothetical protein
MHGAIASSYTEQGAPEHVELAETVVVPVEPGNVIVLAAWDAVTDWTIVTVTVNGIIAGVEAEEDREVIMVVEMLITWLDEKVFEVGGVVGEVFDVVVAVLMQEQALRIIEDDCLHPELIADGVAIAIFVV